MRKIVLLIILLVSTSFSYYLRYSCYKNYCSLIFYGEKNKCYEIKSNAFIYPKIFCLKKYSTQPILLISNKEKVYVNITTYKNLTIYSKTIKLKISNNKDLNLALLINIPVSLAALYSLYKFLRE